MAVKLCTLANVTDRLNETSSDYDTMLTSIIEALEPLFDNYLDRSLIVTAEDVTEYYSPAGDMLQIKRYPVVSITSVKESIDYDFDNTDAYTANEEYRLINDGKRGVIYRMYSAFFSVPDCLQVIYRGGYTAAGDSPGDGETALPSDIVEAAIEQACHIFQRRNDIGLAAVSFDGGSISKYEQVKLLPGVKQILEKYRRPAL